jgi:hypothetical protein
MALVVFLRAVNVGGHQAFQPAALAKKLAAQSKAAGSSANPTPRARSRKRIRRRRRTS